MEINEKLKVSDGMGAWIKDFQESDAPQFKDKSEKERREMAIAAYMSAKKDVKEDSGAKHFNSIIYEKYDKFFFVVKQEGGKTKYFTVDMKTGPKWVDNYNWAAAYVDEKEAERVAKQVNGQVQKGIKESAELDEEFSDKEIKMAYGILNDPRYKSGNLTKAVNKIEQIKKGLSKHPGVQKAMKATTEEARGKIVLRGKPAPHPSGLSKAMRDHHRDLMWHALDKAGLRAHPEHHGYVHDNGDFVVLDRGRGNLPARLKKGTYPETPEAAKKSKFFEETNLEEAESIEKARWDEAKGSNYQLYHNTYTSAINHALAHHEKSGLKVDDEERWDGIAVGSKKPSEGKTTKVSVLATHTKTGKKHMIHVQVYNRGGSNPYELNTYSSTNASLQKEEMKLDEAKESGMDVVRRIVKNKGNEKGVDMQTANTILQIYGKVNNDNKKKMDNADLKKLVDLAQKMMKREQLKDDNLDEVSDKLLDRYRKKAFADQPNYNDGSDKYRKRKKGRDLAFDKQVGRAKVRATKEAVEDNLDEVSDKLLDRYRKKAFADQPSGDDGSDKYRKRKKGRDLAFDKQVGRAKIRATREAVEDEEPASPDEFKMAVKQAEFIQYVGKEIVEHLEAQREFPEWMQNKLSALHQKAKDMHSTLGAHGMDESTITEAKAYKDFSQWVLKVLELKGEMYTNSAQTQISAILGRNASATWDVKKNRGSISHPDLNESNVSEAKSWKQTSMSAAEAIKKYGKENVKVKKGGLNSGEDQVDVFVESKNDLVKKGAEIEAYAKKSGGVDKADMMKVADMLKKGDMKGATNYAKTLDTDPRDFLLGKIMENADSVTEGKGGSGPRSMFVKDSGDDHIIMQLRSAQDLGGMKAIKFRGGKESQVNKMDIDTVLKVHDMLSPEGKRKLRIMVSKSPADLTKAATELRKAMK